MIHKCHNEKNDCTPYLGSLYKSHVCLSPYRTYDYTNQSTILFFFFFFFSKRILPFEVWGRHLEAGTPSPITKLIMIKWNNWPTPIHSITKLTITIIISNEIMRLKQYSTLNNYEMSNLFNDWKFLSGRSSRTDRYLITEGQVVHSHLSGRVANAGWGEGEGY